MPTPADSNNPQSAVDQARRYVAAIPGAVANQDGHDDTFDVAMRLVQDFALSDVESMTVLLEWNQNCSPPWAPKDLKHKVESARLKIDQAKLGCKLRGPARRPGVPSTPLARLAFERDRAIDALRAMGARDGEKGAVLFAMWKDGDPECGFRIRRGDNKPFKLGDDLVKALTVKGGKNGLLGQDPRQVDGDILICEGEMDGAAGVDCQWPGPVLATPGAKPGKAVDELTMKVCARRTVYLAADPDQDNDDARKWRTRIANNLERVGCRVFIIPAVNGMDLDKRLKEALDPKAELARLKAEALTWEQARPAEPQSGGKPNRLLELTDLGNAERYKAQHGDDVVYDPSAGWRTYDKKRWNLDTTGEVHRRAHTTARSIFEEAADAENPDRTQEIAKHAIRSQSRDRLRAMVDVAQHIMVVDPKQFDTDPWLFNVMNGTVSLKTGELRRHRREDYLTRLAPVAYDPAATHPVFETVIRQSMPDEELRRYAQKLFGVTLIGEQVDDILVLMYGPGGTSKTTMIEPFKIIMGDYGTVIEPESIAALRSASGGCARPDLACLDGARLALTTETEDGTKLALGLVKRMSGGDTITYRPLYQAQKSFTPKFTLWIVSNHRPKADSADDAFWRRVRVLPFDQVIPEDQRDPRIKKAMLTECLPAFLRWAVEGVAIYLKEGLKTPQTVKNAVAAYKDSQDPLKDFLDVCCFIGPQERVDNASLRKAYLTFCEAEGQRYPLNPKAFGGRLSSMGFKPTRNHDGRGWEGLSLVHHAPDPDDSHASAKPECLDAAKVMLARLAARGVLVRLDEAGRVVVTGFLTAEDHAEFNRLNGAVKAVLSEGAQDTLPF